MSVDCPVSSSHSVIGHSDAIARILRQAAIVARSEATVFIQGESGTGKGLLALLIHRSSRRREHAFCSVNCAALPDALFESLLFGHLRGSFTGALRDSVGQFEATNGGTLFLDEIESLPLSSQAKLLHVLETHEVLPLGAVAPRRIDVRILVASNVDLSRLVDEGRFRSDLYYRLDVVPLRLPPLRDRLSDVPALAEHFLRSYAEEAGIPEMQLSEKAIGLLASHSWPGNVRQLKNVVEYAALMATDSTIIEPDGNPAFDFLRDPGRPRLASVETSLNLRKRLFAVEAEILFEALRRSGGRRKNAAQLLGIDCRNLSYYLKKHAVDASA
jgi:transcriptional regulator with PAS, ATPase and Fis domain